MARARTPVKGKSKWRGTPLPHQLPKWWINLVNGIVTRKGHGTEELGVMLAAKIGKPEPFTHGVVSRFLTNKVITHEMVEAFVLLYGVPHVWYEAKSAEEALELQTATHNRPAVNENQERRLLAADHAGEAERAAAIDQTDEVVSINEGASRDRRSRRPARRGPSST